MINHNLIEQEIREKQKAIRYDMRTLTIRFVVDKFRLGEFYLPTYQRGYVWNIEVASSFIESMIIGLPTSSCFIAETDDGREEIIDGAQRIRTLEQYVNGDLKLKGLEVIPSLNGTRFDDLPESQKYKFLDRSIPFTTLSPETTYEARVEIFRLTNGRSISRTMQEMRLALLDEPIRTFVQSLANRQDFLSTIDLHPFMQRRGEAVEMVLRFFALSYYFDLYRGNMEKFLDKYISYLSPDNDLQEMEREFTATNAFVRKYLKEVFHSKRYRSKKQMFEAIYVGTNLALRENPDLPSPKSSLTQSNEFFELVMNHASQTSKRVKDRIQFVKDQLLAGG